METHRKLIPDACQSLKAFNIDSLDADAKKEIIEAVFFPYTEFDSATITFPDDEKVLFTSKMLRSPKNLDTNREYTSIGDLTKVPNEIMVQIIVDLDIRTLWSFALVNRHARELVISLPGYKLVVKKFPEILMALFRTKVGILKSVTLADVISILQPHETPYCQGGDCHQIGSFVFLPTLQRCCWRCLQHSDNFHVYTEGLYFRWRPWKSGPGADIQTLPGKYGDSQHVFRARRFLVHRDSHPYDTYDYAMSANRAKREYPYMCAIRVGLVDPKSSLRNAKILPGVCCAGCHEMPIPDDLDGKAKEELYDCKRQVYLEFGSLGCYYLDHFKWCAAAQNLWNEKLE
ncbi:hypothetical protein QBC40DRAFT_325579 [Triangularia verruculosa]|uniref:F-box domain-containing protein n=1 Tax=Triangularia verruculosa TaxID=2587418 RepID=A0AAN6XIM7_9PEZI|nr:hypothetical protein QBC40DRAFT_325579 [Triangularia verruculosa]